MKEKSLLSRLKKHSHRHVIPMHMPGHKRNTKLLKNALLYNLDITEITGFDNLNNANGILMESQKLASSLFKSLQSFYLVNGSTCGLIAAIRALTVQGDDIIISRSSHKSVYNAIDICRLNVHYICPEINSQYLINSSITPKQVEEALETCRAKVVLITSPSYEGVVADIDGIASVCKKYNAFLIVDEAHGAHLGFNNFFPKSAIEQNADIVIQSLHKTLPAHTQCAILHIVSPLINANEVANQIAIFQTSSPSYLLMASMDSCVRFIKNKGARIFEKYAKNLKRLSDKLVNLNNLRVLGYGKNDNDTASFYNFDLGKLVISTLGTNINGNELFELLHKEKIECEMAQFGYVLAMTSVCDRKSNFRKLAKILLKIDKKLKKTRQIELKMPNLPNLHCQGWQLSDKDAVVVNLRESVNMIACETVWIYPPGIPILNCGEIISKDIIDYLTFYLNIGLMPKSSLGNIPNKILAKKIDK